MDISIKKLGAGDGERLSELNALFALTFKDEESYTAHKPADSYLTDFLLDPHNIVVIAESEGHVVGGLVAYCLTKFERERKEVYLYDLAVNPAMQKQGIGKALLNVLRHVSKDLGAYVVFVQADEGDEAIHFYESLGPNENLKTRSFDFNVL